MKTYYKMLKNVLIFFCCSILRVLADAPDKAIKFHQSDYKIQFERIELSRYNKQYIKYANIVTYKYNRTTPVANGTVTFNVHLGNNLQAVAQVYKFLSNEYRYIPIRFQINACDAITNNVIGTAALAKCGNFSECPILKGVTYHVCKWTIDEAQFPPMIPDGKYMIEVQGLYNGIELGLVKGYGSVSRPPSWN